MEPTAAAAAHSATVEGTPMKAAANKLLMHDRVFVWLALATGAPLYAEGRYCQNISETLKCLTGKR